MKKMQVLLLFLIAAWSAFAQSGNPVYPPAIEQRVQRVINSLQMETTIPDSFVTRSLTSQLEYYHSPGIAIAVINDGKIEWVRGFGYADVEQGRMVDTNTLFQAASISKPTTTLAVMKLYEQKKISLDTNVNAYLKSWKIPAVGDWQPVISLRRLLSHTAGLTVHGFPGYQTSEKLPTVVQILNGEPPANTAAVQVNILPGTRFRYSGGGTTVAQLVLTDHFRTGFPELMERTLLTPLQMRHSTFQQPLRQSLQQYAATAYPSKKVALKGKHHIYPEMAPAGLWTTPQDLATMLVEVQKAVKGQSAFISKQTAEEMLRPQPMAKFIGLGFFMQGDSANIRFEHSGWNEGFVSKAVAYKNGGYGAVVMMNSNEGSPLLDEIVNAIAKEYKWPAFNSDPAKYTSATRAEADTLTGTYIAENGAQLVVSYANDQLLLQQAGQAPMPLKKNTQQQFRNPLMQFAIRFGKQELVLDQQGQTLTFKKQH